MAVRTAKVSARRGEETEVILTACRDVETRSSSIQPNPASPVEGFQAASVKIEKLPADLGFGSTLIKGVEARFSNRSKFLERHKDYTIQAVSVPGPIPTGGREGSFWDLSHPSWKVAKSDGFRSPVRGANFYTFNAKGQLKRR
ncbi:uncharacterized protein LOC103849348 [Brassica rapa]|uniref:uncharacterized protein LOC103849348 n=1 Tax=Brassica campestris TaxID=3711 RepID=UPI0004F1B8D8|nr:uncharacterized protein LOC103849348 [Brassica rapa]